MQPRPWFDLTDTSPSANLSLAIEVAEAALVIAESDHDHTGDIARLRYYLSLVKARRV
jgi:hypothetical protein